jgi:hypothetical protein
MKDDDSELVIPRERKGKEIKQTALEGMAFEENLPSPRIQKDCKTSKFPKMSIQKQCLMTRSLSKMSIESKY